MIWQKECLRLITKTELRRNEQIRGQDFGPFFSTFKSCWQVDSATAGWANKLQWRGSSMMGERIWQKRGEENRTADKRACWNSEVRHHSNGTHLIFLLAVCLWHACGRKCKHHSHWWWNPYPSLGLFGRTESCYQPSFEAWSEIMYVHGRPRRLQLARFVTTMRPRSSVLLRLCCRLDSRGLIPMKCHRS